MSRIELVGWALVHSLWQGIALAGVLYLVLRLVDQRRANVRYLVSVLALVLMVVLPAAMGLRSTRRDHPSHETTAPGQSFQAAAAIRPASEGTVDPESTAPDDRYRGTASDPSISPSPAAPRPMSALESRIRNRLPMVFPWLVAFWLVGVLLLSLRLVGSWLRAERLRSRGTGSAPEAFDAVFARLLQRLGISRPVRLLQSTVLQVPSVIGWLRPVVLIPAALASGLTIPQLEAILAHELAHVRRHDYLVNLVQAVIETLLFFHPAAWWVSRQVRQEREHCCDDLAVSICGDPRLYAVALLTLEEHRSAILLPAATGGDLFSRVRRIIAPRLTHAETSPRWLAGLIGVAAVLSLGGAAGLSRGRLPSLGSSNPRWPVPSPPGAVAAPDTVIRHPDPSAPLAARWDWARQLSTTNRYPAYWVGYTIEPLAGIKGSIYVGRLERKGIRGSGGLDLRGRITNFGNFNGFTVPGVSLAPLVGGGMPDDVALLFAFVVDDRGKPVLARVHISSLALPVDLEDRPLLWLGTAGDEESIAQVQSLYDAAPSDLKRDVVAAVGVHSTTRAVVPRLARWLTGDSPDETREEAAEWLGRHPDAVALSLLARAARGDRVSDVRREAAEAVGDMDLPAATDTLIALANTLPDEDARREAVEGLAQKPEPGALAAAFRIAESDNDTDMRREAVETLGEFPNRAGVPRLMELIRTSPSADVRSEAAETIGEAATTDDALRILGQVAREDHDSDVQREAVETLGEVDDPRASALLRELAQTSPVSDVRQEAVETLAESAPGPETTALLTRLAREDRNEDVQHEAIESLAEIGDSASLGFIAEVAKTHPSADLRRKAIETLGESLEPQESLRQLREISRTDRDPDVQRQAVETMGELPAELAVPALIDIARNHSNLEVRVEAIQTLGDQQGSDPRVLETLKEIARSDAPEEVVNEAVEALGEMNSSEASDLVIEVARGRGPKDARRKAIEMVGRNPQADVALRTLSEIARADDDEDVQREAVETLGETGSPGALAALITIARTHPRPEVRQAAIETLSEMGNAPRIVEVLKAAATDDPSADVQEQAIEQLGELEGGAGVPALIGLARDHPNRELRGKALEILGGSDDPRAREAIEKMLH